MLVGLTKEEAAEGRDAQGERTRNNRDIAGGRAGERETASEDV